MKNFNVVILLVIILVVALGFFVFAVGSINIRSGNVAIIPIDGVITTSASGPFSQEFVSSTDVVGYIKEAEEDSRIEAIVIEINSPGGTPVASQEIANAVKSTKKPTYALIREVGASGGYWVASASDVVYASEISIVGSIGVLASYVELAGFLDDHNVTYQRLVGGKYKDIGSPLKELQKDEREILQIKIDKLHEFFIKEVAENRNIKYAEVKELATGEFFLGIEAVELGLVDKLGNQDALEKDLENKLGTKIKFIRYEKTPGLFDVFGGLSSQHGFAIGKGMASMFNQEQTLIKI